MMLAAVLRSLFLAAAVFLASYASAAELRAFDAKSLEVIRSEHAGRPFVVAFWSLYCEPCREEMRLWQTIGQQYPALSIILVATDSPSDHAAIKKFLRRYKTERLENWAFADNFAERLRFAVDRSWRGELPRTYFFDANHHAATHSGAVNRLFVEDWLAKQPQTSSRR